MVKIKVGELKAIKKGMKDIEICKFNEEMEVEIKQYLTILDKVRLVSSIYASAIDDEDELQVLDYTSLDIAFKVLVVEEYSNFTLPQIKGDDGKMVTDMVESYDLIVETGVYDFVANNVGYDEIGKLNGVLENYITEKNDTYERENSIQNVVKNMLGGLLEKLPSKDEAEEFIAKASKEIEGFDPSKMDFIKQFMAKTTGEAIKDGTSSDI